MQTILVLALVLLARGAVAQELPSGLRPLHFTFTADQRARPMSSTRDPFDYAVFAYGATAGADWAVTAVCLEVKCSPQDPVGLFVAGIDQPKVSVPLGLAIDVGVVLAVKHWLQPRHPTVAQVVLYGLSSIRLVILTQRIGDLRRNAMRRSQTL